MQKSAWGLFVCVALVALTSAGCSKRETAVDAGNRTGTLLIGNNAEPADLDPQTVTALTDENVLMALFEGLTGLDEQTSRPVAAAAERWDVSPDGLTYTFHLRAGLLWSNGDPLTADDFVQSWRRVLTPGLAAENAYMLFSIKNTEAYNAGKITDPAALGFAAPDERTLTVTLAHPTPYLPVLTALPMLCPINPRVLAKFNAIKTRGTAWTRAGNLVGNGPFVLEEWSPNARIVVGRNPHYWNATTVKLNKIIFFPTESADVEERNFRAGQVHVTFSVPPSKIATYREREPNLLRIDPLLSVRYLNFNVTKPPLDNPKVRRALAMGIDRTALAERVLERSGGPASHLVPPDCAGYVSLASQADNFATARQLLVEAGFPGGRGLPTFEVQVLNDNVQSRAMEAIQAMWRKELGVNATVSALEQKTWLQNQQTLTHTIGILGWTADFADPVTFINLFVTGGGNNWTGWGDPEFDRLVAASGETADQSQRFKFLQQAETILLEAAPISPLYFNNRAFLIQPTVKGWAPSPLGLRRYQFVNLTDK